MNCNLEENFNHALNLCSKNLSHNECIEFLKNGNVAEKQIAALLIDTIETKKEAEIFISNLTGCDGKIREAVASRLAEFIPIENGIFFDSNYDTFADASIDINANISRLVIDAVEFYKDNTDFGKHYANKLINFIQEGFIEISKIKFRDKKYILNKQLFKIYWALEGLKIFSKYTDEKILYEILSKVLELNEYTVREKAAQILAIYKNSDLFKTLYEKAKNDSNYYVRETLVRNL